MPAPWRHRLVAAAASGWVVLTTALTAVYLDESTIPITLVADRSAARALFPYNAAPSAGAGRGGAVAGPVLTAAARVSLPRDVRYQALRRDAQLMRAIGS